MPLLPDREAVDAIRDLLDHTENWSADTLDAIRDLVLATGRDCAGELGMPLPQPPLAPFGTLSRDDQLDHLRRGHGIFEPMLEVERLLTHETAHEQTTVEHRHSTTLPDRRRVPQFIMLDPADQLAHLREHELDERLLAGEQMALPTRRAAAHVAAHHRTEGGGDHEHESAGS